MKKKSVERNPKSKPDQGRSNDRVRLAHAREGASEAVMQSGVSVALLLAYLG